VEKAFWDKTKSFLQSKVASVASERGKTPRRPRVDRGLQKNTHIADNHAKKLP
jgi:hypothetical protein